MTAWARHDAALKGRPERSPGVSPGHPGFPVDPDFPQLPIATDPAHMLDVFRAHLRPAPGRSVVIEDCIPFRFRCRQASARCVLQYTLRLLDRASGRRWDQAVAGIVYARAGEAERQWQEILTGDPLGEVPVEWRALQPVAFVPELDMLVEVFPYDRKLRHLRLVTGGSGVVSEIEPRLLAPLDGGEWEVTGRNIEPLRYRTELGAALRYTGQAVQRATGRRTTLRCYLKVYRDDRGAATWRLLRELSYQVAREYSVVAPITYLGELRTLAIEQASGSPVVELLLAGHDPAAVLRPVARAVAAFNQRDIAGAAEHGRDRQLDEVRRAAGLVAWACPEVAEDVDGIVAAVVAALPEVAPAPIHRDLKADHVFLDRDRVVFIDLDSVALGDPVRDPAHLYAYLTARVGLDGYPAGRVRAASAAFVQEYFARVPGAWRQRFAAHCAGALIEVASGIFRRQEPEWRAKVIAAVGEARRALK
ncbi:MAG TPA: hypothetical protein VFD76_07390 [Gemmatimonadales bacterium]|nr:hypothetical protein [Gemmatimonadales bacterium]